LVNRANKPQPFPKLLLDPSIARHLVALAGEGNSQSLRLAWALPGHELEFPGDETARPESIHKTLLGLQFTKENP
jgi:hypothetical protein